MESASCRGKANDYIVVTSTLPLQIAEITVLGSESKIAAAGVGYNIYQIILIFLI